MASTSARWLIALGVACVLALSACGAIGNVCEQKCYGQKSNEPRDFDDCIKRCQK